MFGARVAARRKALGWSQRELARRAGLPQSTVGNIETGVARTPTLDHALRLAKALDARLGELAGEGAEGSPPRSATAVGARAEARAEALGEGEGEGELLAQTRCALREAAPLLGRVPPGRLDEHLARTVRLFASALDGCANCQYRLLGRFRWMDRRGINGARRAWAAGPAGSLVASA